MNFFVILTTDCDLSCKYCYGECCDDFDSGECGGHIDYFLPRRVSYDVATLKKFMAKDNEATVIFYGGEPLLEAGKMYEMIDALPVKRFLLHTNGISLGNVCGGYVSRLHTISVSIDGDEALTDFYRGCGVYRKIVDGVRAARKNGFKGETIARMTVSEDTDIYRQALYLLDNPDFAFDSVHWQLNALFWRKDYSRRNFARWARESYDPGVKALVGEWVRVMKNTGQVMRLYPFLGVMESLLLGEETQLRCGAGWAEYAIQTDGNISPCPVMSGMDEHYAGDIFTGNPLGLKKIRPAAYCDGCDIRGLCGGRCLYANITMKWGEKGFREVCSTVHTLIGALQGALPEVRELLASGSIKMTDFSHMRYNSCEIIP